MSPSHTESKPLAGSVASTTRSLLIGLRAHESEAWHRFIKLYTPLVYFWCQKHNLKTDDIPDVVQEVFKSVAEHIHRFRKDRSKDTFRGWLRAITRNKAMDQHRRLSREFRAEGGTEALQKLSTIPSPVVAETAKDTAGHSILFRHALDLIRTEFKESTWEAFWQIVVNGRKPVDVAAELDVSPGSVRVAKCRVLQRLRLELGDLAEESKCRVPTQE